MGEYAFITLRKLICATLVFSLLWPDVARCMDDEKDDFPKPNHSSVPISLLKENLSDQKETLPFTNEQSSSVVKNENLPLSEKKNVSEEATNKEEKSSTSVSSTVISTETNIPHNEVLPEKETSENQVSKGDHKDPSHELNDKEEGENVNPKESSEIIVIPEKNNEEALHESKNPENPSLEEQNDDGMLGDNPILIIEEKEESSTNPQNALFIEEEGNFSEKTKAFLAYFKKRIIDGLPNWKQVVLGGIGGTVLGVGTGAGLFIIINNDFLNLTVVLSLKSLSHDFPLLLTYALLLPVTSVADATMRGATSLMNMLNNVGQDAFLMSTKSYKKRLLGMQLLAYAGSFVASILPIYYLFSFFSFGIIQDTSGNTVKTPINMALLITLFFSIPQIFDTIFAYGNSLSNQIEKEVKKKAYQKRLEKLSQGSETEVIEIQRQFYDGALKKLMWILYKLPDEKIQLLYEGLFQKKKSGEISEDLKTLQDLETLLKVYESYEGENPIPSQQAKKKQASISGWVGAGLASIGRHLVFFLSVKGMLDGLYQVFSTQKGAPLALSWPLSIIFGGIAGVVQGYFEKTNIAYSYYDITGGETVTEPQSWKPLRVINKIWNYLIQGPFYSLPYIMTFLEISGKGGYWLSKKSFNWTSLSSFLPLFVPYQLEWPLSLLITIVVPFFLADAFNNATQFNKTSGQWISAINRFLSHTWFIKYLPGYMKDKIIEIIDSYRNLMLDLDPSVVKELHEKHSKNIPNLFKDKINKGSSSQEDSKTEEHETFLKDTIFYDPGSIDNFNSPEGDIQFEMPKRSLLSSCWRGMTRCYQKVPSLNSCWKGVKAGFTFLFSSCRKRTKEREMDYFTEEDERESIIN